MQKQFLIVVHIQSQTGKQDPVSTDLLIRRIDRSIRICLQIQCIIFQIGHMVFVQYLPEGHEPFRIVFGPLLHALLVVTGRIKDRILPADMGQQIPRDRKIHLRPTFNDHHIAADQHQIRFRRIDRIVQFLVSFTKRTAVQIG